MNNIVLDNVTKVLRNRKVLKDINLALERGKTYAFTGRNASGKTMLLRAVSGLIQPTTGNIEVFGQRISKEKTFPKDMGLVIEQVGLWKHLTGYENLEILAGIRKSTTADDINLALKRVGLDPKDNRKYRAFSTGMRQRLVLAQAIMEKPKLLILDEPTNGLDEEGVVLFREILNEEKKRGTTCLIATHLIEDIEGLYDDKYIMSEGRCNRIDKDEKVEKMD